MLKLTSLLALIVLSTGCGTAGSSGTSTVNSGESQNGLCPGPNCVADVPPPVDTPIPTNAIMVNSADQLTAALQNATGGETIALASGAYGLFTINGRNFSSKVILRPQQNATPVFKSFTIQNSSQIQVSGISVLPRIASGDNVSTAVTLSGQDLIFEKARVNFIDDSSAWTPSQWLSETGNGIFGSGTRITIRENVVKNVAFALGSSATYSLVSRNKINGFRGDGMRGLGDNSVFEYNDVRNCYQVDGNHMDGFQSWTLANGTVGAGQQTGMVLRGNYILEHENRNHPFKCQLQAIGLFDGMFVDWLVENNIIIVNHYHAISFYGAENVKIINNTVIDADTTDNVRPWIMITTHKNGTPSKNCVIRNNIAPTINPQSGTVADHNIQSFGNLPQIFANPTQHDYRLSASSIARDTGSAVSAPLLDFLEMGRPSGGAIDIGAHEYR